MKRKILLLTLAIPVILCQNALAQTSSRLVGEAHWANNGATFTPVDSSSFSYSSNRGGDLGHTLKYDNSYTWTYDTAFHNATYYIQSFDANNNITSRIAQFWDGSAWQLLSNTLYYYNSANQMTSMILQSWNGLAWTPVSRDVYSYNSAGKLVIDQYQQWNSLTSTFDAASQRTYYYDGAGNKTDETDQNYVSGSPVYSNQWLYTYSGINQLLTTTHNTWNLSAWVPSTMTTNTYDSTGDLTNVLFQTYDVPTTSWINNTLDIYSGFTGAHLPTMDIHQIWNGSGSGTWDNQIMYMYTYNGYNQLTSSTGESWNIVGTFEYALGDPMARYYYQTYSTVTSVKSVSNNGGDAKIYPVPAQNVLNVDLNWNEAQAATIAIYDAQGRVVRQWSTPAATTFHSTVSTDNMSEGVYFIKITGAQGEIVKQIVVAH